MFTTEKTHNLRPKITKTSKCTNFSPFYATFVKFLEISWIRTLKTINSERFRCPIGLFAEINAVLKKNCNKDHEIVNKSHFFYIFVFSNAIFVKYFIFFIDQISKTVQQQLKMFSCRLFDGICASF